jgi:hypothetical protein
MALARTLLDLVSVPTDAQQGDRSAWMASVSNDGIMAETHPLDRRHALAAASQ